MSHRRRALIPTAIAVLSLLFFAPVISSAQSVTVPRVMRYRGSIQPSDRDHVTTLTFSVYGSQTGGEPLWTESQAVSVAADGTYSVLLGSTSEQGLPVRLFDSNEARWIGVTPEDGSELARAALVSVPYALKAADADTVGGLPASSFVLQTSNSANEHTVTSVTSPRTPGADVGATAQTASSAASNYIAKFIDPLTLGNSSLFEGTNGVGIGVTAPTQKLDITGRIKLRAKGSTTSGFWLTDETGTENLFIGQTYLASASPFGIWNNNAWRFILTAAGDAGIGVSPASRLDVTGRIMSRASGYASAGLWLADATAAQKQVFVGLTTNSGTAPFGVWHSGLWRFLVNQDGNVGIGVDPTFRLDVAGRVRLRADASLPSGMWLSGPSDTPMLFVGQTGTTAASPFGIMHGANWRLVVTQDGKVGIGTTSPTERFEVAGNLRLSSAGKLFFSDGTSLTSAPPKLRAASPSLTLDTSVPGEVAIGLAAAAVHSAEMADAAVTTAKIADGAITTAKLAPASVSTAQVADYSISSTKLADDSVTSTKLNTASVTAPKLAPDAVVTRSLVDFSVTESKLADSSVTTSKLAPASVTVDRLAPNVLSNITVPDSSITTAKLSDSSVSTAKLIDGSVTQSKIAPAAITGDRLASGTITSDKLAPGAIVITDGSITASKLAPGAVGSTQLADNSVTASKVPDLTIGTTKLTDASVTTTKLAPSSVTLDRLAPDALSAMTVADGSVTAAKLADSSVSTTKLQDRSVSTAKLADGAVTASKIASGTITADRLASGVLSQATVADGAITTAKLADGAVTASKLALGTLPPTAISGTAATLGSNTFVGAQSITGDLGISGTATASKVTASMNSPTDAAILARNDGTSGSAYGIRADTASPSGVGVAAFANSLSGDSIAVSGRSQAPQGIGLYGEGASSSGSNFGVRGLSRSASGVGVQGEVLGSATNLTSYGVLGITSGDYYSAGVMGRNDYATSTLTTYGTYGRTAGPAGIGAMGYSTNAAGATFGIFGRVESPAGIAGQFTTGASSGNIIVATAGTKRVFRVDALGTVSAAGQFQTGGADFAELVRVRGAGTEYEAGDVMVIDLDTDRQIQKSSAPYSTNVAGVISTKPGIIGSPHPMVDASGNEVPLAMVGIVPCKVSAENGPIHRGDLLVVSSTPGHAMRGTDRSRLTGAVVGKALGSLESGTGVIEILVTLQ